LYPGSILTRDSLYKKAARVTLENRLANGGGHTGWSRAWMINFYARLKDGEQAYFHLEQLLKKSTLPNLFDDHPPFQIDGNFGGTAGMAEMLLQSHNQVVELLPALPGEWAGGSIRGIKARGGLTIDMEWKNGRMVKAYVQSTSTRKASFRYAGVDRVLDLKPGEKKELVF
jgi:alpha-L-fucosidase 2